MKEFEAQKLAPSASVVNVNKRAKDEDEAAGKNKKAKSIFSQKRLKSKEDETKKKFQIPDQEGPSNSELNVLNEIVEKNVSGFVAVTQPSLPDANSVNKHFPEAMKLVDINNTKKDSKDNKKSLFAKQFKQMKKDIQSSEGGASNPDGKTLNYSSFGPSSRILTGTGLERSEDITSLHEENLQTLKQMTEEEILEEKEKLIKSMDPNLLNFLKNKTKASAEAEAVKTPIEAVKTPTEAPCSEDRDSVGDPKLAKYPGMSRVEREKVEWQGELPPIQPGQLAGFSARYVSCQLYSSYLEGTFH